MRIGQLRKRVRIQGKTRTQSTSTGVLTDVYDSPGRYLWANVRPLSSQEYTEAQAQESDITHTVTTRYQTPVPSTGDRILLGARVFEIAGPAINPQERNRWLVFKCIERTV